MIAAGDSYPAVPEQRRFAIGEAARLALSKPHIIRYWEKEIPLLAKVERRNGRRYYSREQVLMLQEISRLLERGVTLAGARGQLLEQNDGDDGTAKMAWLRSELQKVLDVL